MVSRFVGKNYPFGAEVMLRCFRHGCSKSDQRATGIIFRRGRLLLPNKFTVFPQSDHVGLPRFRANSTAH